MGPSGASRGPGETRDSASGALRGRAAAGPRDPRYVPERPARLSLDEGGSFLFSIQSTGDGYCGFGSITEIVKGRWRHADGAVVLESEGVSSTLRAGHTSEGPALLGLTDLWQKLD